MRQNEGKQEIPAVQVINGRRAEARIPNICPRGFIVRFTSSNLCIERAKLADMTSEGHSTSRCCHALFWSVFSLVIGDDPYLPKKVEYIIIKI